MSNGLYFFYILKVQSYLYITWLQVCTSRSKNKWIDDLGATLPSFEKKLYLLCTKTCASFRLINLIYMQISILKNTGKFSTQFTTNIGSLLASDRLFNTTTSPIKWRSAETISEINCLKILTNIFVTEFAYELSYSIKN